MVDPSDTPPSRPVSRFGTDGVRGVANSVISIELAAAIGAATAEVFGGDRVVVARDPRRSGRMLEAAAAAGIASAGADAILLGVAPTPAVAAVCRAEGVAGVMISASHNPFADNGLKVFGPGGHKLSDAQQDSIEALIDTRLSDSSWADRPSGADVGDVRVGEWEATYTELTAAALDGRRLDGLRVVVDCANGANSAVAPAFLAGLGAAVTVIGDAPDGTNINAGVGSTAPEALAAAVLDSEAHLGIAFDGDADRVLAVDELGRTVTGDHLIALLATDLRERGQLNNDTVVVTVMTNLGFHRAMQAAGIRVEETPVGDRSVLAALEAGGHSLGGEQSGHIVLPGFATTGDGLLAAALVADVLVRSGQTMSEISDEAMVSLPQVLINVAIGSPMPDVTARIAPALEAAGARLGSDGRVLVRPSGTEPVVRVMVEATSSDEATAVAEALADAVAEADRSR